MSSLDLRARLKRDLSQSSLNNSSHGVSLGSAKRWKSLDGGSHSYQRKVSFGFLNETVLFDKKDSSSNLSLGVSVSNSSFSSLRSCGSSANSRWEAQQPKAGTGNATWNIPLPPPPSRDSRWQCSPPSSRPNMFFKTSTSTTNAFRSLSRQQSGSVMPKNFSSGQQLQQQQQHQEQARCPMRSPSPIQGQSMEVERGVERQSSLMAPPRVPGRGQSPVTTSRVNPQSMDVRRGVARESSLMAPPRIPGRCASPVTILPEPINTPDQALENSSMTPIFGMPPKRPARSASPVTVTPRSSFNLVQTE